MAALWAAGYRNLEGVELVPEQAEIARAGVRDRFPIHCTDGRAFLAERKNRYHLVILNDVLEHFPVSEALPLVTQIYSSLRPGGTAAFRVPNMASLLAGYLRYLDITHRTGFTELSLQQLLDQAGFEDHRFVPDDWGWRPATWRPWFPWRGLGIRGLANQCLHRFLYWLRGQSPKPTRFDWNLEVYSRKPGSQS